MQTQRGQARRFAARHHAYRILFHLGGQNNPEARDVFLEDLDNRAFYPVVAKMDSRLVAARRMRAGAAINRMLEYGNTRFMPQPFAQKNGRIDAAGQQRTCYGLGKIVQMGKPFGPNLEMNLKAGVGGFQHQVVMRNAELVYAVDYKAVIAA